jgi:hypothetical protein
MGGGTSVVSPKTGPIRLRIVYPDDLRLILAFARLQDELLHPIHQASSRLNHRVGMSLRVREQLFNRESRNELIAASQKGEWHGAKHREKNTSHNLPTLATVLEV